MKNGVTIIDIAKECGLSKSTVAYALSGNQDSKVSSPSMEIILSTAKRLGYCPNAAGRMLSSRKSKIIGIMLPSPEVHFYASLSTLLQAGLYEKGYSAFFMYWNAITDTGRVEKANEILISHGVDGIIACEFQDSKLDMRVPTVVYGIEDPVFDSVFFNEYDCFADTVKLLRSRGYRKIAYAGHAGTKRSDGYLDGLARAGLRRRDEFIYYGEDSADAGVEAVRKFLIFKDLPDAVICANDNVALAAMFEAVRNGIDCPGTMAFCGCDDIEQAAFTFPSLSSHSMSPALAASELIEMLFSRMDAPGAPRACKCLDMKMILRDSIGER